MSPRTGRPKSENPKNIRLEIRLTNEQANKLQYCANILKTTRTSVILKGIDLVKSDIEKK